MRSCVHFYILIALCLVLATAQCAGPSKDQNSQQPKIKISVESGDKDLKREGETTLEDVSRMKADREKKEPPSAGILERLKDVLLKLKIPF